jgi:copper chaperone NosL
MKPITRILIALSSLSMIATYYVPLWQIQLWAPQYPEGLNMKIWHNHLGGAFDIINGLNHYIGMRLIKDEMFPEFAYIGILIGIYIALGLITSISGKINLLKAFVVTGVLYGVAALYDFYRWGYDYGHNLDPHAAIQVPGMSYQPPVIGYKNLLNFTAYSGPDIGGWIIIAASIVATFLLVYELLIDRNRKKAELHMTGKIALVVLASTFISSCSAQGPSPIQFGKDECTHCKMTLTDQKFGAEIITTTNKVYKYDDVNCLVNYLKAYPEIGKKVISIYLVDYSKTGNFVLANEAFFLYSDEIRSPMGSAIAAFSTSNDRDEIKKKLTLSESLAWEKVKTRY